MKLPSSSTPGRGGADVATGMNCLKLSHWDVATGGGGAEAEGGGRGEVEATSVIRRDAKIRHRHARPSVIRVAHRILLLR